jgi:hypothetical protein
MFTLSDKQRVLNQPSSVRAFTPTGTEVTIAANIAATDKFLIEGFGHFDIAAITDIQCRRARAAAAEVQNFTVTAPAGIAVGDVVEVVIAMDTARYDSTLFVQDRLGGVKPMVFTTAPLTAITTTAIATAIAAGFTAYVNTFPKGVFQLAVTNPSAGVVRTTVGAGYEAITVRSFSIRRNNQGIGLQPFVALAGTVTTAGFQGEGLGKFLEESIRMNTPITSNVYGVDNAETQVDLRGLYTAVYFTVQANYDENLSTVAADHSPLNATHDFVVFLNEATCLAANSAIAKLASVAFLRGTAGNGNAALGMTTTVAAAPLTLAQEKSEVLIKADGSSTNLVSGALSFTA